MNRRGLQSVEDYIVLQPEPARDILRQVRTTIRKALPAAEETISYNIPAYKVNGDAVLYFAGWKQHYSLYPASAELVREFKDELTRYKVQKGTIRFPLAEPVPTGLIARIAKFREKEVAER